MRKCDGFDDCILGVMERFGQEPILAYDKDKMLDKLSVDLIDLTPQETEEWFDSNIIGAWVGDETPCFVSRELWDLIEESLEWWVVNKNSLPVKDWNL